ncbi:hypothetical protein HDU67_007693 [Dinochytrium kinnereticum]|nr:hypothetical protein HDU67_007693 [Dinochytrium kinnereticum]
MASLIAADNVQDVMLPSAATASPPPPPSSKPTPSQPPHPFYCGAEEGGFAFPTVNNRWPVILTSIIDELHKCMNSPSATALAALIQIPQMTIGSEVEAKEVIRRISELKYEVWRAKPVRTIVEDGGDDVAIWNDTVTRYFNGSTFYTASWLWAECYMYRRIREAFFLSQSWREYDPFLTQKAAAFHSSLESVLELSSRLVDAMGRKEAVLFRELALLSLWGNATDLSMFAGMNEEEIKGMKAGAGEEKIISNDLDALCEYVGGLEGVRFDFILDNSGFELFSDLLLADHLHQIGRANKTIFHLKSMPWFVSDTNQHDVEWLLKALEKPEDFFRSALKSSSLHASDPTVLNHLKKLSSRWRRYIDDQKWIFTPHSFWTTGWAFHHLPTEAPDLWTELSESALLIFKGDLNYRKLVYDCKWPSETLFREAIGDVAGGPPVLSLRTNKSDPCVGLAQGVAESLSAKEADWRWSGKYAVVSFCLGEKG